MRLLGFVKALIFALLCGLALPSPAASFEDFPAVLQNIILDTATQMGLGDKPMDQLPDNLRNPEQGLVLFADYAHAGDQSIPVYLLNRTGKAVALSTEDHDIYLKLEFLDANGVWKRAQAHQFSRCGNSYGFSAPVRNDRFVRLSGYQPAAGRAAKIRFHLYRQTFEITSNVGDGLVDDGDIELAKGDWMAVLGADFGSLADIAQGNVPALPLGREVARRLAIEELGHRGFEVEKTRAVLNAIVATGEEPFVKLANQQLSQLDRRSKRALGWSL